MERALPAVPGSSPPEGGKVGSALWGCSLALV